MYFIHQDGYRDSPIFNHPLFSKPMYLEFKETLLNSITTVAPPEQTILAKCIPILSAQYDQIAQMLQINNNVDDSKLQAVEKKMSSKIDSVSTNLMQAMRYESVRQLKLISQAIGKMVHNVIINLESDSINLNLETDSDNQSQPDDSYSQREEDTVEVADEVTIRVAKNQTKKKNPKAKNTNLVMSHELSIYEINSTLKTAVDVWKEYTLGINVGPSIMSLNETHGTSWRSNNASKNKAYSRRKVTIT